MSYFGRKSTQGGWSAGGKLVTGGNASFTLQEEFKSEEGAAKVYTIQFDIDSDIPVSCIAEISWAVEGNSSQRTISVVNGTSISGPMEAVRVIVRDDGSTSAGHEYNVTINVTPGTRPASYCPPVLRSRKAVSIPPGGTELFAVPFSAGANSVLVTSFASNAAAPVDVSKLRATLENGGGDIWGAWMPNYQQGWVPLPPTALILRLENTSVGTDNFLVSVMFGIDG